MLALVLLSLLSVLFLAVINVIILGAKARASLGASLEMLYIAEAGLAHGQAFCAAYGETSPLLAGNAREEGEGGELTPSVPFEIWIPFGKGEYRLQVFRLSTDPQPYLKKNSGILLVATARLQAEGQRRACLLLDAPRSCRSIAWWEPG